ncbi:hypothetical protein Catovirus_1_746 [Catovirus CTV1]|uniref:Glycosyl transferase family 1 domain-containing protein n=1 Tax=Catovirus CTV1 TaxID=1977631 RepID=A0A1V0SAG6_9VIRU|nr:hypothetical protein Catovirus_1_746 [Catovirus CTV1]
MHKKIVVFTKDNDLLSKIKNNLPQFEFTDEKELNENNIVLILNEKEEKINEIKKLYNNKIIISNYNSLSQKSIDYNEVMSEIRIAYSKKINKKNIIVLGEDFPGYGGYGTYSYNLYKRIEKYDTKMIYFLLSQEYDKNIKNLNNNNIYTIYLPNFFQLYDQSKNYDCKFIIDYLKKNNLDECHTLISISPVTLKLGELCFKYVKHYYRSGSAYFDINKLNQNLNLWDINQNAFNDIIYKNYVSEHYYQNKLVNILPNSPFVQDFETKISKKIGTQNIIDDYYIGINSNLNMKMRIEKKYDIVCAISVIERKEKNFNLVSEIFKLFPNKKKLLIGKNSKKYQHVFQNTEHHELLDNDKVKKFLSMSKIFLLTSLLDAGPSVFIESVLGNCIPLCSINTGFYKTLKKYQYLADFAVPNYEIKQWTELINNILSNYSKIMSNRTLFDPIYHEINDSNNRFYNKIIYPLLPLTRKNIVYNMSIVIIRDDSTNYNNITHPNISVHFMDNITQILQLKYEKNVFMMNHKVFVYIQDQYKDVYTYFADKINKYTLCENYLFQKKMIIPILKNNNLYLLINSDLNNIYKCCLSMNKSGYNTENVYIYQDT